MSVVDRTKHDNPDCWAVYTKNNRDFFFVDKGDNTSETIPYSFGKNIGLSTSEIKHYFATSHKTHINNKPVYPPMNKEQVISNLKKFNITNPANYTIHNDLSVTLHTKNDLMITNDVLYDGRLILDFAEVNCQILIFECNMTTLEGLPKIVNGSISIMDIGIKSLKGFPDHVSDSIYIESCKDLVDIKGIQSKVNGTLTISQCPHVSTLKNLGVEYVGEDARFAFNNLNSLEGGPKHVEGSYAVMGNNLKTLKGSPDYVGGRFSCLNNPLLSYEGKPKHIGGRFSAPELDMMANELRGI
jgi:hypothetical protein